MYRRLIDSRSGACLPRGKGGGVGATISVSAVADVSLYLMVGALQLEDFRHVVLLSLSLSPDLCEETKPISLAFYCTIFLSCQNLHANLFSNTYHLIFSPI